MELLRPMLAAPTKESDLANLRYPLLASPKIDGVRALNVNGVLVSRKLLPIPNKYVQELFGHTQFHGLDGELVVGAPTDRNLMQQTTSGVMSVEGRPHVMWYVFDSWALEGIYAMRAAIAKSTCTSSCDLTILWIPQTHIRSQDELTAYEDRVVAEGYEGVILRDPRAPYKQGRSTLKQGWMLKVKRFADSEAVVLDTFELMHNDNEATTDETGYAKRSTHAANKRGGDTLGGLRVRDVQSGIEFDIGTGFTAEQRSNLWQGRKYLVGKLLTYKHFPIGVKDKPRHPVFKAWRDPRDT